MKTILILSICAMFLLSSCEEGDVCFRCRTTETTSHGVIHTRTFFTDLCGQGVRDKFMADNNYVENEVQWIGPGPNDSLTVEIVRETECSGVIYNSGLN